MLFMKKKSLRLSMLSYSMANEILILTLIASATLSVSGCNAYGDSELNKPVLSTQKTIPNVPAHTEGKSPLNSIPVGISVIFVFPNENKGLIQSDLELAGATFSESGYNTILLNAGSKSDANLIARAKFELAASKRVVIDSDGSPAGIKAVSKLSGELAGLEAGSPAVCIEQSADGGMQVTPLETEAAYKKRTYTDGNPSKIKNTAAYVLVVR